MVQNVSSKEEFDGIVESGSLVVVDFYADWCGPCRAISPFFASLTDKEEYKDVVFIKVDAGHDQTRDICEEYKIKSLPTFLFFYNGKNVGHVVGADRRKLDKMIETSVLAIEKLKEEEEIVDSKEEVVDSKEEDN